MRKQMLFFLLTMTFGFTLFAQESKEDKQIEKWYQEEQYDKIIAHKPPKNTEMSAFYYRAKSIAYSQKENWDEALKNIDIAIKSAKVSKDYYIKGFIYSQKKDYPAAIKAMEDGIAENKDDLNLWYFKGTLYQDIDKWQEARECYLKCRQIDPTDADALLHLTTAYMQLDSTKQAMQLVEMVENDPKWDKKVYARMMDRKISIFNEQGEYEKSKSLLLELYKTDTYSVRTITRLMQVCNRQEKVKEALEWRAKLYDLYNDKHIDKEEKDFVFERFEWDKYKVVVVENFDQKVSSYLEIKHVFYFYAPTGEMAFKIQTESSSAVKMTKAEYVLCKVDDRGYHTFWQFSYDKNPDYVKLKKDVLEVAEGKAKAGSETIIKK